MRNSTTFLLSSVASRPPCLNELKSKAIKDETFVQAFVAKTVGVSVLQRCIDECVKNKEQGAQSLMLEQSLSLAHITESNKRKLRNHVKGTTGSSITTRRTEKITSKKPADDDSSLSSWIPKKELKGQ